MNNNHKNMCRLLMVLHITIPLALTLAYNYKNIDIEKEFPSLYMKCVALFITGLCSAVIGSTRLSLNNQFCNVHSLICLILILAMFYNKSVATCLSRINNGIVCMLPVILSYIWPCFAVGNLDNIDQNIALKINSELQQRMMTVCLVTLFLAGLGPDETECPGFRGICLVLMLSACWSSFMGLCRPIKDRYSRERWAFGRVCRVYSGSCFVLVLGLFFYFILSLIRGSTSYRAFCFGYAHQLFYTNYAIFNMFLWGLFSIVSILMPILLYNCSLNFSQSSFTQPQRSWS